MNELWTYWQVNFNSALLLLLLLAFRWVANIPLRSACFWVAMLVTVLCFFSPLHLLSAQYLFSAHMVVHVLLLLVVGPLLVLALPPQKPLFTGFFTWLKKHPVLGWLIGLGVMWFWHVPVVFNAAMGGMHGTGFSLLSLLENLSLILAGVLFAAPVLHPWASYRIDALSGVVYLFTACIGCSLLGLLITFAPVGTYQHFLAHHDMYALNGRIRSAGITQAIDQQAAGLIMWVPCCLLYVSGAMYLLVRWLHQKESVTPLNQV